MKIEFKDVSKSYGVINALKNINFSIEPGDFVFLVGPSGAGKSSLIKLILQEIKPSSGEILFNTTSHRQLNSKQTEQNRRKIGVIFQDYQLIFDKNIEENIALALDINNYPKQEIPQRIEEVINQVGLASRRFLFPSQLSGGEMQRAALARAIAIKPEIILADEPTGNLDAKNAWNLVKLLSDINASGTTVLMTTHNLDIVSSMNKTVYTIYNGELKVEGSPSPAPKIIKKKKKIKKVITKA